jgi:DNA (cytosine-5)-methyltransferase 1
MGDYYAVDMFSGGGGFSLGAELAGAHVSIAVELDHDIASGYSQNFPSTTVLRSDVRDVNWSHISGSAFHDSPVELVIGGPPCQGFSIIGRRDPDDARNLLIQEFFRAIIELQPSYFVMENVPNAMTSAFRHHVDRGVAMVGMHYRVCDPMTIIASDYGASTDRRRVFIVGSRRDVKRFDPELLHTSAAPAKSRPVGECITGLKAYDEAAGSEYGYDLFPLSDAASPFYGFPSTIGQHTMPRLGPEWAHKALERGLVTGCRSTNHAPKTVERFAAVLPGGTDRTSRMPRLKPDGYAPTLRAGTAADRGSHQALRPIHPYEHRVITVREAARLQGFPDWFVFHPSKWHSFRAIGNSVPPAVARAIVSLLVTMLRQRDGLVNEKISLESLNA